MKTVKLILISLALIYLVSCTSSKDSPVGPEIIEIIEESDVIIHTNRALIDDFEDNNKMLSEPFFGQWMYQNEEYDANKTNRTGSWATNNVRSEIISGITNYYLRTEFDLTFPIYPYVFMEANLGSQYDIYLKYTGIRFTVRGSGVNLNIKVCQSYNNLVFAFTATGSWKEYMIAFEDMSLEGGLSMKEILMSVNCVRFYVTGWTYGVQGWFEIDDIEFIYIEYKR